MIDAAFISIRVQYEYLSATKAFGKNPTSVQQALVVHRKEIVAISIESRADAPMSFEMWLHKVDIVIHFQDKLEA